ncbi:MAG: hypothetical protein N3D84_03580, partial [Candidatus Woesearchaeota archaeon]|nr:hypothetical protein [Candidatus Woesearchaeota archaeon]
MKKMADEKQKEVWSYEVIREGEEVILRVDCSNILRIPSIEDDPLYMAKVIETLAEVKHATRIILYQKRDYEYGYNETQMLLEIARLYSKLLSEKEYFSFEALNAEGKCIRYAAVWYNTLQNIILRKLKEDPISCYVEIKRLIRDIRIDIQKTLDENSIFCMKRYAGILSYIEGLLEKTKIISIAKPKLIGYKTGDREIYRDLLHPIIKPDFMFTKLMANYPPDGEEID